MKLTFTDWKRGICSLKSFSLLCNVYISPSESRLNFGALTVTECIADLFLTHTLS
jgi:hypothetical protein